VQVTGLRVWDTVLSIRLHYAGVWGAQNSLQDIGLYSVMVDSIGFQSALSNSCYQITFLSDSVLILPARLQITGLSTLPKIYNDSNNVHLTGTPVFTGLMNQEQFPVNGQVYWNFGDAQVGENKPLTRIGNYTIASQNYWVEQPELTGSIVPKTLMFSLIPLTKEYGDSLIIQRAPTELAHNIGLQGDDQLIGLRIKVGGNLPGNNRRASVGQYHIFLDSVLFSVPNNWNNYLIASDTGILTIYPAPLIVEGLIAQSKVYDGTDSIRVLGIPVFIGLKNGDIVQPEGNPSWKFPDIHSGVSKLIVQSGLYHTPNTNYQVIQPIYHADILPRALVVGGSRPADGTAVVSHEILTIMNLIQGDGLLLSGFAMVDSIFPGNRQITMFGNLYLSGSSSGNYTLNGISGQILIVPRVIRLMGSFEVRSKLFDGTASASISASQLQFDNLISGFQGLQIAQPTVQFKSIQVGTNKRIQLIDYQVSGPDLVHYLVDRSQILFASANIEPHTAVGSLGDGNEYLGDSCKFLGGVGINVGLNLDVSLGADSIAAGDSLVCYFTLHDLRGRLAEFYPLANLILNLIPVTTFARLLTPSGVSMSSGVAVADVSVDRGGFYRIHAWFRSSQDSIAVISDTFHVRRPIARLAGSFDVLPKTFDGAQNAYIGGNYLHALVLPTDSGLVWIDSIRLEFMGTTIGAGRRVNLVYCILAGPMAVYYDFIRDGVFSYGEIRSPTGKNGEYGGNHTLSGEWVHLDGRNLFPSLKMTDFALSNTVQRRSGDTISLQVEFRTIRGRRADYIPPTLAHPFLIGTQFSQTGHPFLQGDLQDTVVNGLSGLLSMWIGKGGSNLRVGVKSCVDGIWLYDTSGSFDLLPPFLRLSGSYRVADKAFDGNVIAHVSDFSGLRGMVDLPAPFNNSFPPLTCQASFISPGMGVSRRVQITAIQFSPAVEAAYEIVYAGYRSFGNIFCTIGSGGLGNGHHFDDCVGILMDGASPVIQLAWSNPPALRGSTSNVIRAGDTLTCAIKAFNQRGVMAEFYDLVPVQIKIQFSSAPNRLFGSFTSQFYRGEALFPHFVLNRAGRILLGVHLPQNPPFPTAGLISDSVLLLRPLLTIAGTFGTCYKIFNGSKDAVLCQHSTLTFNVLPFGNDVISIQSARPYFFSSAPGMSRKAYLSDTSLVLGDSALHYDIQPVLLLGSGNIYPPNTRGGQVSGNHFLAQQGVFLEGSVVQYSLHVSQQAVFLRGLSHSQLHNRAGDTFSFEVKLYTQRNRTADYSGQLPVRFSAIFQSTYPVRLFGDTVINLSHSVAYARNLAFNRSGSALAVRAFAQIPAGQALTCTSSTFTLSKAVLNVGGIIKDVPKLFDGTTQVFGFDTTALVYSRLPVIAGILPADQIYLGNLALNYRSAAVGSGKRLLLTSFSIGGSDSMHYETGTVNPILIGEIGGSGNRGGQRNGADFQFQSGVLLDGGSPAPFTIGWLNSPASMGNRAGRAFVGVRSGKPGVGVFNHRLRLLEHMSDSLVWVGAVSGHPKNPIAFGIIQIPLNRGYARMDSITLNRGGQGFKMVAKLKLGMDSLLVHSDSFNLEKPVASLLGDFRMTSKKYDGGVQGTIYSHSWRVLFLPVGGDSLIIQPTEVRFKSPLVGDRKKAELWSYTITGQGANEYEYINRIHGMGVISEGKFGGTDSSVRTASSLCRHLDWSSIDSGRVVCLGLPAAQARAGEMFQFRTELQTGRGKWAEHIDSVRVDVQLIQGPVGWLGFEFPSSAILLRGKFSTASWTVSRGGAYQLRIAPISDHRWQASTNVFTVMKPLSLVTGSFLAHNRFWNGTTSASVMNLSDLQASRLTFTQDEVSLQSITAEFLSASVGLNKRIRPVGLVLGGRDAAHYDVVAGNAVYGRASIFSPALLGGQLSNTVGLAQKAGSFLGDSSVGTPYLLTRSSSYSSLPCGDEIPELEVSVVNFSQRVVKDWGSDVRTLPDFYGNRFRGDSQYFMEGGRARILNLRAETSVLNLVGLNSGGLTVQLNQPAFQFLPCVLGHTSSSDRSIRLSGVDLSGQRSVSIGISGSFSVFDKLYDGNRNAQIANFNLQIIGQSPGDVVYLNSVRANFRSAYSGDQKLVVLDTSLRLSGPDASKYRLAFFGAPTTSASIVPHSRRGFTGQGSDFDVNGLLYFSGDTALVAQGDFVASGKFYDGHSAYSGQVDLSRISLSGIRVGHQVALGSVATRFLSPLPGDYKMMCMDNMQLQGIHSSRYRIDRSRLPKGYGPIFSSAYLSGAGLRSASIASDTLFLSDGSVVSPRQLKFDIIRGRSAATNRWDVSYRFTDSLNRTVPWGSDCVQFVFSAGLDTALPIRTGLISHSIRGGGWVGEVRIPVFAGSNKLALRACNNTGSRLDSHLLVWQSQYPGMNGSFGSGSHSSAFSSQGLDGGTADVWVGGWPGHTHNWFEPLNWSRSRIPDDTARIIVPRRSYQPEIQQPLDSFARGILIRQPGSLRILDRSRATLLSSPVDSLFPRRIGLLVQNGASISTEGTGLLAIGSGGHYVNLGSSRPNLRSGYLVSGARGWRLISAPILSSFRDFLDSLIIQGVPGSDFPNWQPNVLHFLESDTGTQLQSWRSIHSPEDAIVSGRGQAVYVFNGAQLPYASQGHYRDSLPKTLIIDGKEPGLKADSLFSFGSLLTYTPKSNYANEQVTPDSVYTDLMASDAGWNLLGNPTASPLFWDPNSNLWHRAQVDASIYVWDPIMNDHVGGYRYWNGQTGNYQDTINGLALIRPFQAFWIRAHAPNPILTFRGEAKWNPLGGSASVRTVSPIQLNLTYSIDGMSTQGYITFSESGKSGRDELDAYFLPPHSDDWVSLFTLSAPGSFLPLSINNLPVSSTPYRSIPLFVQAGRSGMSLDGMEGKIGWQLSAGWPNHWYPVLMDHIQQRAIPMRKCAEHSVDVGQNLLSEGNLLGGGHPAFLRLRLPEGDISHSVRRSDSGKPNLNARWPYSIAIIESEQEPDYSYRPDFAELYPPFPNPARSNVWFKYFLPEPAEVRMEVCDLGGRKVWSSLAIPGLPGIGQMLFDRNGLSAGVYVARLLTQDHVSVQRFVLY